MRKTLISAGLVLVSALYVLLGKDASFLVAATPPASPAASSAASAPAADSQAGSGNPPSATVAATPAPTPAPITTPKPAPAPAPKPKGQFVDGTYTGSSADAYYGTVQVQAVIQNGRIADVVFLQYPNDRSTSRFINGQATPYLRQEAIQAQSANVDIVSGATDTSMAFQQSLASALAKAKTG